MTDTEQLCLACGIPVPQSNGPIKRLYCDKACKQKAYRQKKAQEATEQQRASEQDMRACIVELEEMVRKLEHELAQYKRIVNLDSRTKLIEQVMIDADNLYRSDTEYHTFKSWLKKQGPYPEGSFMHRFIADKAIPPRATHGMLEEGMKKLRYSAEDKRMFRDLWIVMLREQQ